MSIAQRVYAELIENLRTGTYKPGDRIRAEDIAKTFEVSRTPVREALSRLQERGLLEMAAGGLSVARLERADVMELYDVRELLEGSAARMAAQHASPSDLYTMKHIGEAFANVEGDAARMAHLNHAFHDAIYKAAHNKYLLVTLEGMHDTLMLLPSTTFAVNHRQGSAVTEHQAIIDAIEARDPEMADRLARDHIRKARETRLDMMFTY